jgi:hypothetical protein
MQAILYSPFLHMVNAVGFSSEGGIDPASPLPSPLHACLTTHTVDSNFTGLDKHDCGRKRLCVDTVTTHHWDWLLRLSRPKTQRRVLMLQIVHGMLCCAIWPCVLTGAVVSCV